MQHFEMFADRFNRAGVLVLIVTLLVMQLVGRPAEAQGLMNPPDPKAPPVLSGCEYDYPPFCVTDGGHADGFSVELLRASLKAVNREVTFKVGPWANIKDDLAAGRLQALPMVARTPDREGAFDFTFPYLTMHGTVVVRDGSPINGLADLDGKRVAVLEEDVAHEYLRRANPRAVVVPLPSFGLAMRELSVGKHDAVVIQKLLAFQLMKSGNLQNLKVVGPPLAGYTQTLCFAVRKGDQPLLSALNEGLSIAMADGTFRKLHAQWFSQLEAYGRSESRIVVGGDSNYPPYEFLDANAEPAGYNVDLTRAIARQMGLSVEIRLGPWGTVRDGLNSGAIDLVHGMFYSAQRDATYDFSPPHARIQHVIVVRKGAYEPPDMGSLSGKSIVVMSGDIMEDLAIKHGYQSQLTGVKSQEEALRLLAAGKHDCALVAKVPALYWIRHNGWRNLSICEHPALSPEYCYAAPHRNDAILAEFSEGLAAIRHTGEFRAIQAKWLGPYEDKPFDLAALMKYGAVVIVPLLALLAGMLLWSRSLRAQVVRRTHELQKETEASARMSGALRLSLRKVEILAATAGELLQAREPQKVVDGLCRQVMEHLNCDVFVNFLMDRTGGGLRLNACGGIPEPDVRRIEWLDIGVAICGCVARDGRRIVASNIPTTPDPRTDLVRGMGVKAYACHPLLGPGGEVLGTLSFGTREREVFDESELALMKAVADHVAVAMARMRAEETIRESNAAAEQASRAKDQFIAVLSHELRTPLTPAMAALSMMRDDERLPEDVREDVEMVNRNIALEVRLIADLLDVSRVITGKLHLEKRATDVAATMREAAAIVALDVDAKGQTLRVETPGAPYMAFADAARLQQAFWNLLRNAVKFSPEGAEIVFRARVLPVDRCPLVAKTCPTGMGECPCFEGDGNVPWGGGNLIVEVIDRGVGIDAQMLPRLFRLFEQEEKARSFGGLGLGLSICKAVVEMHGGSISAHSDGIGSGATFTVRLPVAQCPLTPVRTQPPATSAPIDGALPVDGTPLAILLVEDHADTAKLLRRMLMSLGHVVATAGSVAEGLRAAEEAEPDVLISDLGLPDGSGLDLMQRLRARGQRIPGIVLSGFGTSADIEKSRAAGFSEHLVKPLHGIEALAAALARLRSLSPSS